MTTEFPVFDGHNDLAWELRARVRYDLDALDLSVDQSLPVRGGGCGPDLADLAQRPGVGLHTDLPRLAAGGVAAQYWSVWVSTNLPAGAAVTATLEQIDVVRRMVDRFPTELALATSADEVERARERGRIASLIGMEGGHSIDCSLGALRMTYALGARYLTLTHVTNVPWADSATDEPRVGGLSPFGHEVVREMNRLGMLVDLSHVAPSTMHAALDTSVAPAFFSHSSARALCDHPRNVPDDVLSRVAASDGLVMVTFVPGFLNEECRQWMGALGAEEERLSAELPEDDWTWRTERARWVRANPCPPCGVSDVADHVEHVREVAGVDHVGLGGDYDGIVVTPKGLDDVSGYPALFVELTGRGWSEEELTKLAFGNALRVLRDTEAAARAIDRDPSTATFEQLDGAAAS